MKKRFLLALVCAALCLTACSNSESGSGESEQSSSKKSSTSSKPDSSTENVSEEPPASTPPVLDIQTLGEKLDFPETPLSDFDYEINNSYVSIEEYFGKNTDVRIPEAIEGLSVYFSGNFNDHGTIKRLILPKTIDHAPSLSSLEYLMFEGDTDYLSGEFPNLKSVYFCGHHPLFRTIIKEWNCPFADAIKEHTGLITFGDELLAAQNCEGDMVIPEGITAIGYEAFYDKNNESITSVKLPSSLKEIDYRVFYDLKSLESVTLPDGIERIDPDAFAGTPWLESLKNEDNLCISGKWLLDGKEAFGHVTVPDGVTHIAGNAFGTDSSGDSVKMQSVTLPEGLVYVGEYAFLGASFKDINIPSSVKFIGNYAFRNSSLFDIDKYKLNNGVTFINDVAIINNNNTVFECIIPEGVTQISWCYLSGSVGSFTLPDSYTGGYNYFTDYVRNSITYKGNTYDLNNMNYFDLDEFKATLGEYKGY